MIRSSIKFSIKQENGKVNMPTLRTFLIVRFQNPLTIGIWMDTTSPVTSETRVNAALATLFL